jgi:hypothetical protein
MMDIPDDDDVGIVILALPEPAPTPTPTPTVPGLRFNQEPKDEDGPEDDDEMGVDLASTQISHPSFRCLGHIVAFSSLPLLASLASVHPVAYNDRTFDDGFGLFFVVPYLSSRFRFLVGEAGGGYWWNIPL